MKLGEAAAIALFGSIWGLLEATVGGALHAARIPFAGAVMSSIGFSILYSATRAGVSPSRLFAVAIVAASFKFLDAPLFGIPPFAQTIVNPAVAIAAQGLAAAAVLRGRPAPWPLPALATRLFAATAISMIAFNAISLLAFGWGTDHSRDIANAALVQLPLSAAGATALSLLSDAARAARIAQLSPRAIGASAAAIALIAAAARFLMSYPA
jgi:hypothetical protein